MRRVYLLVAVVGCAAIAGFLNRGGEHALARQEEAPAPRPVSTAPSPSPLAYQGVASCASVACHHGNGPPATRGSEYTTWIAQDDPHSRAYAVLFDRRSLAIEKNLNGLPSLKEARPHQDVLCLRCHVSPDVDTANPHERFSYADGVGCESCHGPAEKWLSVHHTREKSREDLLRLGMGDTKDIRKRAEICVKCHVGTGEADVNHDLIAAGHPRLRFEYGAYLANYPARHWRVTDDRERSRDFEAHAWLLGQVVSAKAATELLEYRADPKHDKPWPEFAEYSCFACHHDLRDQNWRRKSGAGSLSWGSWYFSLLPPVAGELHAMRPTDREPFGQLAQIMDKTYPDRKRVVTEARNAAIVLDRWADGLQREHWDEKALARLLIELARNERKLGEADWDSAAQLYLGLAAVYHALGDANPRFREDRPLKQSLLDLAGHLNEAFSSSSGGKRYDSPHGFTPETVRQDLSRFRKLLNARGAN